MRQQVKHIQQQVGLVEAVVSLGLITTIGVMQLAVLQQLIVMILVNTTAILIGHVLLVALRQDPINQVVDTAIVDKREKESFSLFFS